jgi:hypothetical protein
MKVFIGITVCIAALMAPVGSAAPEKVPYPKSMAALGDSLTLAYATIGGEDNSWSTGGNPKVRSQYVRILAAQPSIKGHAYNLAESGADLVAMKGQARRAIAKHVDYVTVWGGEDGCGTPNPDVFQRQVDGVFAALAKGNPKPRGFVASILNPSSMYHMLQAHRAAAFKANRYGVLVCGMALGTKPSLDVSAAQLEAATESVRGLNAALAKDCASYGSRCKFDNNAVFGMPVAFSDFSDLLHYSISGQRKLADVTWRATFPFGR